VIVVIISLVALFDGRSQALYGLLGLNTLPSFHFFLLFSLHLLQLLFNDGRPIKELMGQVIPADVPLFLEVYDIFLWNDVCGERRQLVKNFTDAFGACVFGVFSCKFLGGDLVFILQRSTQHLFENLRWIFLLYLALENVVVEFKEVT
jgi:hypothetical protein